MRRFKGLVSPLVLRGRRAPPCHGVGRRCAGSGEAAFAHPLATADTGEHKDEMPAASLPVPAPLMVAAADHARRAGLALVRLCLRRGPAH